ncbi:MAG TPA: hypothetical protein VNB90_14785 [Cytophagaceae bacterium]|jgi:hypothetical protein|nr:hypothetical protein [Cytophagaceae bacterium]
MEILINKKIYQCVICLQDNKKYVYNIKENPNFQEDDFAHIKCFPLKENGKPDFSKEIEICGKYLIHEKC